jgi:hypothetical protein
MDFKGAAMAVLISMLWGANSVAIKSTSMPCTP